MKRQTKYSIALLSITILLLSLVFVTDIETQEGGDFKVIASTIDGGGGTSTGGDFVLGGTAGQPDSTGCAAISGGDFTFRGGFWGAVAPPNALHASLDGANNLVLNESCGLANDALTISFGGANVTVSLAGGRTLSHGGITGASGDGTNTLTIPVSAITGAQIIINSGAGDDTLTIDFGDNSHPFTKNIVFNGQSQTNSDGLILKGTATFTEAAFGFTNENDGTIDVTGSAQISYTGLEPITSTITATNVTLNYSPSAETITISDATGGNTTVDSTAGEITTFTNPTGTLTINSGDTAADIITLSSLPANYPASITIDGQGGSDTVNINGAVSTNGTDLTISTETLDTNSPVTVGTGGSILFTTDAIAAGAPITGTGTLTIRPQTGNTTIGLGGGGGTLNLDDTELGRLTGFSAITIGKSDAMTITLDTATFNAPVFLITGGKITDGGTSGTDVSASSVTFDGTLAPGASPGIFTVAGNVTFADNSTFEVELDGFTPGEGAGNHDQLDVSGTVTIGSKVTLAVSTLANYVHGPGELTIIANDNGDAVVGTFRDLPENAQYHPDAVTTPDWWITYLGLDGNDVVLNAESASLAFSKSFTPNPVAAGETVTVTFFMTNTNLTYTTTNITFSDDLEAMLSGLVATGLPANDVCGSGSQISGTDTLSFTGGELLAGAPCTFDVTLQIPITTTVDVYTNTTSALRGLANGLGVSGDPAVADLEVIAPASITIDKVTTPSGDPTQFSITLSGGPKSINRIISLADASPPDTTLVVPGSGYAITETLPVGWRQLSASCDNGDSINNITVESNDNITCTFTNELFDFGDAPDPSYPTFLASSGARHLISPTVFMGAFIDGEPDGQPNGEATGDDTDFPPPPNIPFPPGDEEGVVFTSVPPLVASEVTSLTVTVSAPGFLNAWADFNDDGDWADAGEQVFVDLPVVGPGPNPLTFTVPAAATPTTLTFSRFRFSTLMGAATTFTGTAASGEVEDYALEINGLDYGDAPDPTYPTLLASDGARHILGTGPFLGISADFEPDGQPTVDADGDDLDINGDDEDGVSFDTPLLSGQAATVTIRASAPIALNAWIDFDSNGVFDHPSEQIFSDVALVVGPNTLPYPVPLTATTGITTYARFRANLGGGLTPTGLARDGEVEDYPVQIQGPAVEAQKSVVPLMAIPGDTISYTVSISNTGAATAFGVLFSDTIEPNVSLVTGTVQATKGSVTTGNSPGDTDVEVDIGSIAGNGSEVITITFRVTVNNRLPAGVIEVCNNGAIFGLNFIPTPTNEVCTPVDAAPDLTIVKDDGGVVARPGDVLSYTITFSNTGTDVATGVVITDIVPVGQVGNLSYASSGVAITDTGASPPYVWEVADLAVGQGGIITITGQLSATLTTSTFTNTVVISTTTVDANPRNNSSDAEVTVIAGGTVETATGTGTADFRVSSGRMEDLAAVAEGTLACPPIDLDFPHGFFSLHITGLTPCASETVVLTITLPSPVPTSTQYWKCHDGAWLDVTSLMGDNDGDNVLTLTLTDGGLGDDDGLCNGEIVDDGGPGQPRSMPIGGVIVPVNKLDLLAPWMRLVALASLVVPAIAVVKRCRG